MKKTTLYKIIGYIGVTILVVATYMLKNFRRLWKKDKKQPPQ